MITSKMLEISGIFYYIILTKQAYFPIEQEQGEITFLCGEQEFAIY